MKKIRVPSTLCQILTFTYESPAPLHAVLFYTVCKASHPPLISSKNWSLPQREGKCIQVFSSDLYHFLNLSLQYLWPTGLEIINTEKFRKLVTVGKKCEHPGYYTSDLDSVLIFLTPEPTHSVFQSRHFKGRTEVQIKTMHGISQASHLQQKSNPT